MEINTLKNETVIIPQVAPANDTQQLEKQNPNVQQNIQTQVLKDATQGPSSPTSQNIQLLAGTQAVAQAQNTAQQQIRAGFLDVKI